ncbi:organic solvent tolerance protein : Organic solvent tolerance protein OstA-like protein OS=Rhodopirellula maiorica SM1 GN=RMSM_06261 PE=4 SV=1: OstA_C [Tuwongella immobilis]|uniref:LptD C-terminal domain-containing protein n=2 Tax=Tuwongella immobilis TaxID=692036 RepID=A0A6C2YKS2_9BACT|nr:organic solvent tolerance protein : Organic solvent tolerance protein OstA-like protein OS=Rhodopirellula maiorica SM1 GN=RMSM_06261 PE=4 SV=1: OstA_C [Tuwongella immobilis]VTS00009.1 organic solvent tolerance protein : Organic solvent tolerance protein OstA-like protein OS=Rhodopirellula maiorica SM1 GN=RMSM_06261 PE=4 SV=1: OstA_C [Tuwongella immobilis]
MQVGMKLLLGVLMGLLVGTVRADEPYRRPQQGSIGNWPMVVQADSIASWTSGPWRILALDGNVFIEQNLTRLHAPRALLWIDAKAAQTTKVTRAVLVADGGVRLEDGSERQQPEKAVVELATRGDVRVKSKSGIDSRSMEQTNFYRQSVGYLRGTQLQPTTNSPQEPGKLALPADIPSVAGATGLVTANMATPAVTDKVTPQPIQPASLLQPLTPQPPNSAPPLDPVPGGEADQPPVPPLNAPPPAVPPPAAQPPASPFLPSPNGTIPPVPGSGSNPGSNPGGTPPGGMGPFSGQPPRVGPTPLPGLVPSPTPNPREVPLLPGDAPPPARPDPRQLAIPLPSDAISRILQIAPRFGVPYNLQYITLSDNQQALVVTGGIILTARFPNNKGMIDIEADRLVVWTRGNSQEFFEDMRSGRSQNNDREVELYLTGNVEIRYGDGPDRRVLRAKQVYYDVNKNKAIAVDGDLEMFAPQVPYPAHVRASEIWQLSPEEFQVYDAEFSSSQLPSDPALTLTMDRATIQERKAERFFLGRLFAEDDSEETERIYTGRHMFTRMLGVPFFYLPYVRGNVEDPLGPLNNIAFRQDQIFGTQFLTTWDVYQLFGLRAPQGHKWNLYGDYLSERGPAIGTGYDYNSNALFGFPYTTKGTIRGYYLYDEGQDQLGGARNTRSDAQPPDTRRGRFLWRHQQDLPSDFTYMGQYSYLSDKNFLESYNKFEFDTGPNQETFAYLKWQPGVVAGTLYANANQRDWVSETQWLPQVEAQGIGLSFFERLTYNVRGQIGHAESKIPAPDEPLPPLEPTEVAISSTRFNLNQELSMPFQAGPVKVVPYGVVDLAHYTQALDGSDQGRFYGGGGVRASMPLSRLYSGIESELFNVQGIYHKMELSGNYFASYTDVPFSELPQLDRLNDDATDQSIRDITNQQPSLLPGGAGLALQNDPWFNPQTYAIRRLVDSRVDTLDSLQVVQASLRQRFQTKRGYPGLEHTTDWIVFDISSSFFPNPTADNFGENVAFLEYRGIWNIGDRTGIRSEGWFDPFEFGTRYWNVGAHYNRTDNTSFSLTYRQFDPVNSKAVTALAEYSFSPKYAVSLSTTYDFGIALNLSNQLTFTRRGSDMLVRVGFSYNAIVQNFGFTFEVVPLLLGNSGFLTNGPATVSR